MTSWDWLESIGREYFDARVWFEQTTQFQMTGDARRREER